MGRREWLRTRSHRRVARACCCCVVSASKGFADEWYRTGNCESEVVCGWRSQLVCFGPVELRESKAARAKAGSCVSPDVLDGLCSLRHCRRSAWFGAWVCFAGHPCGFAAARDFRPRLASRDVAASGCRKTRARLHSLTAYPSLCHTPRPIPSAWIAYSPF